MAQGIQKARAGIPAKKLGGVGTAAQPSIVFSDPARDEKHVSSWTLAVLETLMARAGVKRIVITSTYRDPKDQARVMLKNITPGKSMYAGHGRRVERLARNIVLMDEVLAIVADAIAQMPGVAAKPFKKRSTDEIIAEMADEIEKLEAQHGQGCVSRHQIDPAMLNVVDIAANAVVPRARTAKFIAVLTASARIRRIGLPKGSKPTHAKHFVETQPCIHLEIPQLNDAPGGDPTTRLA